MEYDRTKPLGLPEEQVIPEWVEWFTIDADGMGAGYSRRPIESPFDFWCKTSRLIRMGRFAPPEDWKKARWHLEDGKWVQK